MSLRHAPAVVLPPAMAGAMPPAVPGGLLVDHVTPFLGWFKLVRQRADNAVVAYERDLRAFTGFCAAVGVAYAEHVSFQVIEAYMATIQHGRHVGPRTVNR